MRGLEHHVGQVLDEKYRLEKLLGQGGMGAVYLATHLGTERYVALKLISPQFMRNEEFVERFKREARAAGRLRHPNVVDVTDFGFSRVKEGQVAYLVMEYLDGCTLGDVLAEEKSLPLEWVVDILEQVCSAVHEAHQQGIVHRDLKPDNIWLEPNRLGSYRVKVLDFGIAKVGEIGAPPVSTDDDPGATIIDDLSLSRTNTFASAESRKTAVLSSADLETNTLLQATGDEQQTQHFQSNAVEEAGDSRLFAAGTVVGSAPGLTQQFAQKSNLDDDDGTLLFDSGSLAGPNTAHMSTSAQGSALTRVGAIMGTPLYMSPEQCGGGYVDTRSDIYSLGVIAYQMLAGEVPFAGNTSTVMRAHREETPQDIRERAAKVPKRVAGVIMSALSKSPAQRPQTAFSFASSLKGQSEGIGALYRRAFSLYSDNFPKFVKLSFMAHLPVIVVAILMSTLFVLGKVLPRGGMPQKIALVAAMAVVGLMQIVAYFVAAGVISGVTAIIVTQLSAAPLRPVDLKAAFSVLKRRWRSFANTMIRVTIRIMLGYLLIIPGLVMSVRYALYAPVVLIEGLEKKAAMRRARELASRSWRTVIIVSILQILIPMCVSLLMGRIRIGFGGEMPRSALRQQITQQILGLVNIFVIPLMSIVPALLYLKMRQLGGEPVSAALAQIEAQEKGGSEWQQRMRTRLNLHTPISQKPTTAG
jgi:serine/threonine protein kinase